MRTSNVGERKAKSGKYRVRIAEEEVSSRRRPSAEPDASVVQWDEACKRARWIWQQEVSRALKGCSDCDTLRTGSRLCWVRKE